MKLADLTSELRRTHKLSETMTGVIVLQVDADGASEKAGIKVGAVIQQAGQAKINGLRDLRPILARLVGPITLRVADSESEFTLQ